MVMVAVHVSASMHPFGAPDFSGKGVASTYQQPLASRTLAWAESNLFVTGQVC